MVSDECRCDPLDGQLHVTVGNGLLAASLPGFPGPFALGLHGLFKAIVVQSQTVFPHDVRRQVHREPEGVVELEHHLAGDDGPARLFQGFHLVAQDPKPGVEGLDEALLLVYNHFPNIGLLVDQVRVGVLHGFDHDGDHLVQKGLFQPQHLSVARRPAKDAPQDIAAPLIAGEAAVADQKGHGPAVVGDDAHGDVAVRGCSVGFPADFGHETDDGCKEIGVVVAADPLDDGGQTLQTHARVDVGLRQGREVSVLVPVELSEDVVPQFQMAVAVALDAAFRAAAAHPRALIVENFRTGTTGACFAHHPEIAVHAHSDDPLRRDAHLFVPDFEGLVVILVDGDPEFVLGEPHFFRQKFPAPGDGFLFEIVAEGEVSQHLEERVVTGGVSDVFQVVVLASGPDGFL